MELMRGRISVIMPVYNAEPYLRDILNDLLNQSYSNIELIIIDDGSSDGSAAIIQEYASKNDRVQFLQIENSGPSKARNIGLEIATGEYIRFIDADDRVPKDSMKNMIQIYNDNSDVDLVIGNFITDINRGYFTGKELKEEKVEAKRFAEIFIDYTKSFYFGVPWNKLYKRGIIEECRIRFNENIIWCEDFLFNVAYYSACNKMYILNIPGGIYKYCTRETGITFNISKREMEEIQRIDMLRYKQMQEYCNALGLIEEFELEWKYSDLYERLAVITRYFRNESIRGKYRKFKQYLNEEDAYKYICSKLKKTNYKVWRLLKESIETKKYLKVFLFFIVKGVHGKYVGRLFKKVEKDVQENETKK